MRVRRTRAGERTRRSEALNSAIISFMCGRYRLSRRKQIIEEYFDSAEWQDDWSPRYNIAPTQTVPVIRQHPKEPVRQISSYANGVSFQHGRETRPARRE